MSVLSVYAKSFFSKGRNPLRSATLIITGFLALSSAAYFTPSLVSAQSPSLPSTTPAALFSKVFKQHPSSFSGTIVIQNTLLGPLTSVLPKSTSLTDFLGTQTTNIWVNPSQNRARLQLLLPGSEQDYYLDKQNIVHWDSSTLKATLTPLPHRDLGTSAPTLASPQNVIPRLIKAFSKKAKVSMGATEYVAGVPAYSVVIKPIYHTLLKSVVFFIDAQNYFPLGFELRSVTTTIPVFSLSFSRIQFGPILENSLIWKGSTPIPTNLPSSDPVSRIPSKILEPLKTILPHNLQVPASDIIAFKTPLPASKNIQKYLNEFSSVVTPKGTFRTLQLPLLSIVVTPSRNVELSILPLSEMLKKLAI